MNIYTDLLVLCTVYCVLCEYSILAVRSTSTVQVQYEYRKVTEYSTRSGQRATVLLAGTVAPYTQHWPE